MDTTSEGVALGVQEKLSEVVIDSIKLYSSNESLPQLHSWEDSQLVSCDLLLLMKLSCSYGCECRGLTSFSSRIWHIPQWQVTAKG